MDPTRPPPFPAAPPPRVVVSSSVSSASASTKRNGQNSIPPNYFPPPGAPSNNNSGQETMTMRMPETMRSLPPPRGGMISAVAPIGGGAGSPGWTSAAATSAPLVSSSSSSSGMIPITQPTAGGPSNAMTMAVPTGMYPIGMDPSTAVAAAAAAAAMAFQGAPPHSELYVSHPGLYGTMLPTPQGFVAHGTPMAHHPYASGQTFLPYPGTTPFLMPPIAPSQVMYSQYGMPTGPFQGYLPSNVSAPTTARTMPPHQAANLNVNTAPVMVKTEPALGISGGRNANPLKNERGAAISDRTTGIKRTKKELQKTPSDESGSSSRNTPATSTESRTSIGGSSSSSAAKVTGGWSLVQPSKPRKGAKPTDLGSEEDSELPDNADDDANEQRFGERRLAIIFESYGTIGNHPQTIGTRNVFVPDGLIGKFTKYSEDWIFEIHHGEPIECKDGTARVCITWIIRNCGSGNAIVATETAKEAMERDRIGRTICNRVFREAVEKRREEYTQLLKLELAKVQANECKVSNLQSLIKTLSCKRFAQGPLVFGLYHSIVQQNLAKNATATQQQTSDSHKQ